MPTVEERFWQKVDRSGECWLWTAATTKPTRTSSHKYGVLRVNGRNIRAHIFSWELHNGPVPEGMKVCHTCDVTQCVNPGHLFIGTQQDNMVDMHNKGRNSIEHRKGYHLAYKPKKLTQEIVDEVRATYRKYDRENGLQAVGNRVGLSVPTVRGIITNKLWPSRPGNVR